ncbi:hypothetical protein JYT21_00230 [bacterium AH-315-B15]|nr:hypothetical protein [bacterium AH-315-B15]
MFYSCSSAPSLDITEEEIDEFVASKLNEEEIYDITFSLRFSKGLDTIYESICYEQDSTLVLYAEEITSSVQQINRNTYYKEGLPIFVEEYEADYHTDDLLISERKIYLNGAEVIKAYQRQGINEIELEANDFKPYETTIDIFDFDQPADAILQEGEFALRFGEFLEIGASTWLVAQNEKSGYEIALLILTYDDMLVDMLQNTSKYEGASMNFYHTFFTQNGIDQMVYSGVEFKK